ncbi:MAG: hypothetical protein QM765_11205 [Myxococcales bacterium]
MRMETSAGLAMAASSRGFDRLGAAQDVGDLDAPAALAARHRRVGGLLGGLFHDLLELAAGPLAVPLPPDFLAGAPEVLGGGRLVLVVRLADLLDGLVGDDTGLARPGDEHERLLSRRRATVEVMDDLADHPLEEDLFGQGILRDSDEGTGSEHGDTISGCRP